MYGRVSNHEIIIPYLAPFVGSGVRRVWRGRRCVWSVDDGVEKVRSVWSGSLCGAGVNAGVGMRGCGVSCVWKWCVGL